MRKQKTSVLFISNDGKSRKPLQIPTQLVLYWRRYILLTFCLFIILGLIIGLLIYQQTSSYYIKKLTIVERIKMQTDISRVEYSFQKINTYISKVNQLLQSKGLPTIVQDTFYGNMHHITFDNIKSATQTHVVQLEQLAETLSKVPVGKPHPGAITSTFGNRSNPFSGTGSETHKGIDFRGISGEPVRTTAGGQVSYASIRGGYGNCVIVTHRFGLQTLYGHLSAINVAVGQKIASGYIIGRLGSTGRSTGPHLHYEIHKNGTRIDPYDYLNL